MLFSWVNQLSITIFNSLPGRVPENHRTSQDFPAAAGEKMSILPKKTQQRFATRSTGSHLIFHKAWLDRVGASNWEGINL
jgi:hypothetical protein